MERRGKVATLDKLVIDVDVRTRKGERALKSLDSSVGKVEKSTARLGKAHGKASVGLKSLAGAVGAVGAAYVAMAKVLVPAVKQAAKAEIAWRKNSDVVKAWARDYADAMGLVASEQAGYLGNLQDMIVPTGMARDAASEMSKKILVLANDLAAFNGLPTGDVVRDIQSAIAGSTEVLNKYGAVVKQSTITARAQERGLLGVNGELSEQNRLLVLVDELTRKTTDAQGAHADQMDTLSGVMGQLSTAWTGFLEALGVSIQADAIVFLGLLSNLLNSVTDSMVEVEKTEASLVEEIDNHKKAIKGLVEAQRLETMEVGRAKYDRAIAGHNNRIEAISREILALNRLAEIEASQDVPDTERIDTEPVIKPRLDLTDFLKEYNEGLEERYYGESEIRAKIKEGYELWLEQKNALDEEQEALELARRKEIQKEIENATISSFEAMGNFATAYYNVRMAGMDKESEEYKKLAKEKAIAEKASAIVQTTINGAVAAIRALADLGPVPGTIAASAIAALTTSQIALIASQPIPSFATGTPPGGYTVPPGYEGDNYPVMAKSGERVDITPAGQDSQVPREVVLNIDGHVLARALVDLQDQGVYNPSLQGV
jgi:hypothetical protein